MLRGERTSAKLLRPSRGLWHPAILVMQSTENGRRDHSASRREVMARGNQRVLCSSVRLMPRGFPDLSWHADGPGCSAYALAKDAPEMALVQRDQPVETLLADRPDQALAERVGLRRSHGRLQDSQPVGLEFRILSLNPRLRQRCVRLTSDLRWLAHEGPPARPASRGRHNREGVWPRWRARGDRGESPAQAATDRPAPCSPAGAEPDAEGPATLRIRVALPQSGRIRKVAIGVRPSTLLSFRQALVRRK
jgi:hypothetical protein